MTANPGKAQRRSREDGPGKRGPTPKETPDGAPEGVTPSQGGVQRKDRRVTRRAVPSLLRKGGLVSKLGRIRAVRTMEHC